MLELGQKFDVKIIGGNISKAPIVFIDSVVFGNAVDTNIMLTRSSAIPGDQIAVTGYLGGAAGGLQIINNDLLFEDSIKGPLMQALNRPFPRVAEGQILVTHEVKCAIDISDGLIADLGHICQGSHVGAIIDIEAIPVYPAAAAAFGRDALDMAISGGEDYQLLFTAGHDIINNIKNLIEYPVTIVGEIIADDSCGITLRDKNGNISQPKKTGWNHFGK
jgi:thiamine-monophosphate kinase